FHPVTSAPNPPSLALSPCRTLLPKRHVLRSSSRCPAIATNGGPCIGTPSHSIACAQADPGQVGILRSADRTAHAGRHSATRAHRPPGHIRQLPRPHRHGSCATPRPCP